MSIAKRIPSHSWWRAAVRRCPLLFALTLASVAAADDPPLIKVMPLGDSLTAGYPFAPGLSYRKTLRDDLALAGFQIDYVGEYDQNPAQPLLDLAHQGRVGATIEQIADGAAWQVFKPDLILLMAGTNDFRLVNAYTAFSRLAGLAAADELGALVEKINDDYRSQGLSVDVFVSSIPPMGYATVSGGSTVLTTLLQFLTADRRGFDEVGAGTGAVDAASFNAAFLDFLTRRRLMPDLAGIFRAADADGSAALSQEEYDAAIKLIGEFILNKYIGDYNANVRALAGGGANVHFVDAGSQLSLADYADGTHPSSQQGYDKLAPAWLAGLRAFFAGAPRYWVDADGIWSDGRNWGVAPGGPGGAGEPMGGSVYLLQGDGDDRTVTRDASTARKQLLDLRIDATGGGDMTLVSQVDLNAVLLAAGVRGRGRVEQGGGTSIIPNLILGSEPGGDGAYRLAGADGVLRSLNQEIGFSGRGVFTQDGGVNDVLRQLILGFSAAGSGSYTLNQGDLSTNEEYVGLHGSGVFTQTGGAHRVEFKTQTAGGLEGTLSIAGEAGGAGTFKLRGGTLSALHLRNGGTFDYRGGTLTASQFLNRGLLRVRGIRQLNGDLFHYLNARIDLGELFGAAPSRLDIAGAAEMEGGITLTLAPDAAPQPGDSVEIMTATHGISPLLEGQLRLPLLPGKLILRPALADQGRTLRVTVSAVDCDDVRLVRARIGRSGGLPAGDVNQDGVVDVRDLAIIAKKLPAGVTCTF